MLFLSLEEKVEKVVVKKEPEATFEMLCNPARVMPAQRQVISLSESAASRYAVMKDLSVGGIVLLRDYKAGEKEDLVEPVQAGGPKVEEDKEPEPPEPFEYIEDA